MKLYVIQEKVDDNTWFDLYCGELYMLKKMILAIKSKHLDKKYRIIKVYQ